MKLALAAALTAMTIGVTTWAAMTMVLPTASLVAIVNVVSLVAYLTIQEL